MAHCNEISGDAFIATKRRTTTGPQSVAGRPTVVFPPAVLKSLTAASQLDRAQAAARLLREGSQSGVQSGSGEIRQKQSTRLPARRVGEISKSTKPDIEIYRPPPPNSVSVTHVGEERKVLACTSSANGPAWTGATSQHNSEATTSFAIQALPKTMSMGTENPSRPQERPQEITSARSVMSVVKSASSKQEQLLRQKEAAQAPPHSYYLDILRKAQHDPDSLTFAEAETLANAICRKVTEDTGSAKHAATFCGSIAASQKGRTSVFLQSLVCICHDWFNRRDVMLAESNGAQLWQSPLGKKPTCHRWAAFVEFVAELLVCVAETADRPQVICLAEIIIESCHAVLSSQGRNKEEQMEWICRALHRAGEAVEKAVQTRMGALMSRLFEEFIHGDVTELERLILLELLELRASGWRFVTAQRVYYEDHRAMICHPQEETTQGGWHWGGGW